MLMEKYFFRCGRNRPENDGNTNRLITLCPTTQGKSVCVDFTMFNTYYDV